MSNAKARHRRRWRARRTWNNKGGSTAFLALLFGRNDELHYRSTRPSPFMNHMRGRNHFGARYAYVTETDPGPLDGPRAPYDRGYAEAPDEDWFLPPLPEPMAREGRP